MKLKKFSAWSVIEFSWLAFAWLFFGAGYCMLAGMACSQTSQGTAPMSDAPPASAPVAATSPVARHGKPARPTQSTPAPELSPNTSPYASCRGANGSWYCPDIKPLMAASGGTGTPGNCGPVCTVTDWYLDPQNASGVASDANSCTAATGAAGSGIGPCLTMGQIVQRYGTFEPKIANGVSLTIHQLSPQTAGVDVFYFDPKFSGASKFVWDALTSAPAVGAPFSPTTVTARVQSAVGNDLQMTGALPGGLAANQLIKDVTRSSWAMVKSAGGTATITQPFTATSLLTPAQLPTFVEDNGWVHTDTFQLYTPQACNWRDPQPTGGDSDATFADGSTWIQGVDIKDLVGPGGSNWATRPTGTTLVFALSIIEPFLLTDGTASLYLGLASTMCLGSGFLFNVFMWGGYIGTPETSGNVQISGDAIVDNLIVQSFSGMLIGTAHFTTTLVCGDGCTASLTGSSGPSGTTGLVWGAATSNAEGGGHVVNNSGSSYATILKLAAFQLDGVTVFDTYLPSSATWVHHAGPFTAANIDTGGGAGGAGVLNARDGSCYCAPN